MVSEQSFYASKKVQPKSLTEGSIFYYQDSKSGISSQLKLLPCEGLNKAVVTAALLGRSWVLDTRYQLIDTADAHVAIEHTLVFPDRLTMFGVRRLPSQGPFDLTTNQRDVTTNHGGVYYIGDALRDRIINCQFPNDLDIWQVLGETSDTLLSTRRFPYPVRILSHMSEPLWLSQQVLKNLVKFSPFTLDIEIVRTDQSIYESHRIVCTEIPTEQSVLFIDSDFVPNSQFWNLVTEVPVSDEKYVHLWYADSACNSNVYGHGGPKLINKSAFDSPILKGVDMTTNIGAGLTVHPVSVGTHAYNWSDESSWRTAFREAFKLRKNLQASICTENRKHDPTVAYDRLNAWVNPDLNKDRTLLSREGALLGAVAAETNFSPPAINDYQYLHELYLKFKEGHPSLFPLGTFV